MKTKFSGILTLLLAFLVQISFAQEKTISGTVLDGSGLPLPGASVLVKGTTNGTSTDFDGKYSIIANQGATLVFSFVGYTTQEASVGNSTTINIIMKEDTATLDEVVVIAYGTTTKQAFTGTATTIKSENIAAKNTANVSQALAGEVAGVQVINSSGQPGTVATVRIRGFGSVNGNRSPLYVVDGVPLSDSLGFNADTDDGTDTFNPINSINPEDIASITVLKDATATAIYGSRGANGVIVITTLSGKKNSSSIEVDVKTGINASLIPRHDVIKSADEYIQYAWESVFNQGAIQNNSNPTEFANANLFGNRGLAPEYNFWTTNSVDEIINPDTRTVRPSAQRKYSPENWEDFAFQASFRTEANLKMSGGGEKSKYFTSVGYLDDQGYSLNSDYKRYSARLNLTQDVKPWLTSNLNLGYAYSTQNVNGQSEDSGSVFFFVDNMPSIYPLFLRDANGNFIPDPIFGGNQYDYGRVREFSNTTNGLADAIYDTQKTDRHDLNANLSLVFNLADGLTLKTQYGLQYNNRVYNSYSNPFYGNGAPSNGNLFRRLRETSVQNFLQLLRYQKQFGQHNLNILAAHESNKNIFKENTAEKNTIVIPGLIELNNFINGSPASSFQEEANLESFFTQVNYNYKNTYYLSASLRRDGSSRFIKDKWDNFGSVGLSWVMTNESFLKNQDVVDFLKLKASYGIVGEQSGIGIYPGYTLFNINNQNNNISLSEDVIGNPDLTWETSKMFQVGAEMQFGDYVDINLDYYIKNTDNLLFSRRVPIGLGFSQFDVNDGQLRNSGLEFDVATHIVNKQDFKLDFSFNGEVFNNELTAMPIDPQTDEQKILDVDGESGYGRTRGRSIYDFYMREWAGVDSSDGAPMWVAYYYDENSNGIFDENAAERITSLFDYKEQNPDREISKAITKNYSDATENFIGKTAIPKIRGAFRLSSSYKNVSISTQFIYSLGGYGYDFAYADLMHSDKIGSNNWHKDISNRWQKPGDITDVPRLSNGEDIRSASYSTRFLVKTDFLSLNNVIIGYNLPTKYLRNSGIRNVDFWLSGDNLFLLSARNGYNPTTAEFGESSIYTYAPLSNFTLGLKLKF
jgi:TonB-linked SusC/RagA family outer membrane protein